MVSIELLATDGESTKRILWVSHQPKGVSAGFHHQGIGDIHWTHHVDGSIWQTMPEQRKVKIDQRTRLDSFHGLSEIPDFTFRNEVAKINEVGRPYEMKPIDHVLFVDLRSYREGGVGFKGFLLEPFSVEWLRSLLVPPANSNLRPPSEAHLLTMLHPWLVFTFRSLPVT